MELNKESIQNLRQDYRSAQLAEADVDQNPIAQFGKWFQEALDAQLYEPNVMTLATADLSGKPTARILLLKGFDHHGFVFYTNYASKKGQQLDENPQAAMVFFWAELERQVRIEGIITKVSSEESTAYFHSRPKGSQIGAAASPQSAVIPDREILENRVEELSSAYAEKEVPRPEHWGGYVLKPSHIEFWQGRSSRLHDRITYTNENDVWTINRLAP
jgi:pyridoxamine 5'-phosphate oxidase